MSENDDNDGLNDNGNKFEVISIVDEMKRSYLDYAMSVIVSRALPDVRDGLKPVHRRIIYSMASNSFFWNKPYRKSARVVGDVIGKYHPHGDSAIYDALARMAQDFSMRLPLVDGQGNFGSIDGDLPAAMRYTEARLAKVADYLVNDLDKETVDFRPNYDSTEQEPEVFPACFPNLLVNGASGIAVGMATNIPPHNLREVIAAAIAMIDQPDISLIELMNLVPGPDFPTGAMVSGTMGVASAYKKGRGSIIVRAKLDIEQLRKDKKAVIVSEIPYQLNKTSLIEKIVDAVKNKRIVGISDIRDESDRSGMRIVLELKRDVVDGVVINQLYKYTPLQSTFGANFVALVSGRPKILGLQELLKEFVDFRFEVVVRRIRYLLKIARKKAHLLIGLVVAVANIEKVIAIIRAAADPKIARQKLLDCIWDSADVEFYLALVDDPNCIIDENHKFRFSLAQVNAILELRLQRLTALGREELDKELKELAKTVQEYLILLADREKIAQVIKNELIEVSQKFGTDRKTEIIAQVEELEDEDLIKNEEVVVTVTYSNYIKRVPLDTYRAQKRGGKGRSGMKTKEEDFVSRLYVTNTHSRMLFFSSRGLVYELKVWKIPVAQLNGRGKALINLLPLQKGEVITSTLAIDATQQNINDIYLIFATSKGFVRRNKVSDFARIGSGGKIAMKLVEGDRITGVNCCNKNDDVVLATSLGKIIRFPIEEVRLFVGRSSRGVRGITLGAGDKVISLSVLSHVEVTNEERAAYGRYLSSKRRKDEISISDDATKGVQLDPQRLVELETMEQIVLSVSANGYGKRTSSFEYRTTGRGGKGITSMVVNSRNGDVVDVFPVEGDGQIMLITNGGKIIRCGVSGIPVLGRVTQGVVLLSISKGEKVVSIDTLCGDDQVDLLVSS